ncbi:MmcB family DNA repair protein [Adhaeribacter radiodurans]|uniref:MmcB family DNA repair protein n=1 Tax=Adhaeribacter radiodurans TaxID=2745197 RepID=A0A7L7L8D2_9BACT|nr:MmcB family DNA repair protein [Adhaeribacter radiodurans]QMU29080.1 MmcB family DNA repair protein [Adhaeribacter radiodurans]
MKTEKQPLPTLCEMETAVAKLWDVRRHVIVPNISWGMKLHECDLLILTKANYAIEVEIKRSKADLKKDVEKAHAHQSKRIKELWFAIPEQLKNCLDLIPEHAGIIIVKKRKLKSLKVEYRAVRKRLPVTNKEAIKLTEAEVSNLKRLGCMRIWSLKATILNLQQELQQIKEERILLEVS